MGRNETGAEPITPVRRLCNEIQLFDLCELEQCSHKDGRFCSNRPIVARFESIAEEESSYLVQNRENELVDEEADGIECDDSIEQLCEDYEDRWED